jgi:hypothetical protein
MIGILTVMPLYSRSDTRRLHFVLEKALQKYSQMINRRRDEIGWFEGRGRSFAPPGGESAAASELSVR